MLIKLAKIFVKYEKKTLIYLLYKKHLEINEKIAFLNA